MLKNPQRKLCSKNEKRWEMHFLLLWQLQLEGDYFAPQQIVVREGPIVSRTGPPYSSTITTEGRRKHSNAGQKREDKRRMASGYYQSDETEFILYKADNSNTNSPLTRIFQVLEGFHTENEDAYTPRVVSISPLHHGKPNLEVLEPCKWRLRTNFDEELHVAGLYNGLGPFILYVHQKKPHTEFTYRTLDPGFEPRGEVEGIGNTMIKERTRVRTNLVGTTTTTIKYSKTFSMAELNKPVAKNGLVESGAPTNVKKSSGSPSTEKQKHHYLLLQALIESSLTAPSLACCTTPNLWINHRL
ncbi:hypothetical protein LguiA_033171 [Lonicera macranthoides]